MVASEASFVRLASSPTELTWDVRAWDLLQIKSVLKWEESVHRF